MDFFEEIDLPTVGKKYIIKTIDFEINIIVHDSGKKDIYFIKDDQVVFEVTLNYNEAKNLGLILTEAIYKTVPKDKIDYIQKQLIFEWIKIPENSYFIGKTLSELDIRRKSGVSVIAIIRDNQVNINPDPLNFKINHQDILVCIGNRNQLRQLEEYILQPPI